MLLFIPQAASFSLNASSFQYISCYCLSNSALIPRSSNCHFNTSHVTVYPRHSSNHPVRCNISIHLMLLFILHPQSYYLFCFHISIHLMLLFIPSHKQYKVHNLYFNTSHVTVYPGSLGTSVEDAAFQYISCYCLSNELTPFYIFLRI